MKIKDLIFIAFFAVLIVICSWISIPSAVPFTLQTFAIFLAMGMLKGVRGTLAVVVYVLLGAVGLPVFSGFKGGIGALIGPTGGYIIGFIFSALVMGIILHFAGGSRLWLIISMVSGLLICYIFGSLWFMFVYSKNSGPIGFGAVLTMCVLPYIIPDIIKIILAYVLILRLRKVESVRRLIGR